MSHTRHVTADELRQRAEQQRSSVKRAAEALQERLREKSEPVKRAFQRAREGARHADAFVHRHHWAFVGASVAIGTALGVRGGRRRRARRMLPPDPEETRSKDGRHGLLGGLAGLVASKLAAAVAREAAGMAVTRFEQWRHEQAVAGSMAAAPPGAPAGPPGPEEQAASAGPVDPYVEHAVYRDRPG